MKKKLLFLIMILSIQSYSQVGFQKGYYINNNDQKIECEIRNLDWKTNPLEFQFRYSADTEQNNITIDLVKEFGIYNYSKYIRRTIKIDIYSGNLSTNGIILKNEKDLFLKVLVEGKANLYQYEDKDVLLFFYTKEDVNNVQQLLYKNFNYNASGNTMVDNNRFKQQLFNEFKCDKINEKDLEEINYEKNDLVNFFTKYNQCNNPKLIIAKKPKKDLFNLTLRPRINNSSLSVYNLIQESLTDVDFGSKIGFGFGIETEFILPVNNNKWSILVEPTYQYFKAEKRLSPTLYAEADYTSIELASGFRHYFFLKNNSKIFINGLFIIDLPVNSSIKYESASLYDISLSTNFGFGIGYKLADKFSLEARYHTTKTIVNRYRSIMSEYNKVSLIFGYTLF